MGLKEMFCRHQWELVHKQRIDVYDGSKNPVEYKYVYIQRCPKCGKLKKTTFKV